MIVHVGRWVAVGLMVAVLMPESASSETAYRKALNGYWKNQLKEEGLAPIFYASTIHAPKSVWVEKAGVTDFFASGKDLLPDSQVPILVSQIALPIDDSDRKRQASLALQVAGMGDVTDANLELSGSQQLKWSIRFEGAEMHFFAKRDARRFIKTYGGAILTDYLSDTTAGERLFVVAKAVFAKGAEIEVTSQAAAGFDASLELKSLLSGAGFKFSADKKTATFIRASEMYYAVGFRELSSSGLKSASTPVQVPLVLDVKAEMPEVP